MLALAAGLWGPLNSVLVKQLIDSLAVVSNDDTSYILWPAALIVLNFLLFDNITWRSINYIWATLIPKIQNQIIAETMDYALSHSHNFYQNNLSGKISKKITILVDGVTTIITYSSANFLRGSSLLFAGFIAAYFVNSIFFFILISWFVFFAGISVFMSRKLVALSDRLAHEESVVVGELVDSLANNQNVRIFSRKSYESIRMLPFFGRQKQAYVNTNLYSTLLSLFQGILIAIMIGFCMFALMHLHKNNLVTVGDFALILMLSIDTANMMWFTMFQVGEFNKAVGRSKQSLISLISPIEIIDKKDAYNLKCKTASITFKNVRFNYKDAEALFENKSITIPAGQKVGLVGYSGSGKSTFVNLILRLYDVTKGKILINEHDIKNITQDSLREHIGMIPQDPSMFNRSIMENIRYGKINATDEEVIEAAKKAHAHNFICKLPYGYNSLVGERGIKLSGGQRQRIAIARAILKNAPILIMDEATSQLDSVTEAMIQESLSGLMQNKTTLVIAHRLSTLLYMDRILVFDNGRIVEDGPHQALLSNAGLYKTLWDAQVGGFLRDNEGNNE
jgi:ATP-binding cassette subfamily B protein